LAQMETRLQWSKTVLLPNKNRPYMELNLL
jgi:hypothetical protein